MKYNKIIVLCLAGIGDTLLFTPTLDEIIKKFPDSNIDVLVMYKSSKELLEASYGKINIIWHDFIKKSKFESLKFILNLRKNKYDLCITSYPANRFEYNLVAYLTGAKKRIAHNYFIGNYFLNLRFLQTKLVNQNSAKDKYLHNVEENLKLAELVGIQTKKKPEINIKTNIREKVFAENYLKENNLSNKELIIGIHAGTAEIKNLHLRRWAKEKFAELIDLLIEKNNAKIFLFGGPNETNLKQDIYNSIKLKNRKFIFLINDTTMAESIALMRKCRVFVSNDSSLMHIAAAIEKPVIAIFGPTNIKWVYPYNTKYIIATKNLPCSPCYFYSKMELKCKNRNFECMKIPVEEVYNAVERLIG